VVDGSQTATVTVWLDRPEHGNALDRATVESLHLALDDAESHTHALVVRARGSAFCAGADVREALMLLDAEPVALLGFFDRARDFMARLVSSPVVSVAVVQGLAAAGGLELATACDIIVATPQARFADRHLRHGFLPAFGATTLLPDKIGERHARAMLLAGVEHDVTSARRIGLVDVTVDDNDGIERFISRLDALDTAAVRGVKNIGGRGRPDFSAEQTAVAAFNARSGYRPGAATF
jgi:2-(1,2-epoxy-1,2-dihydrophenyl)acetyl-CoA isomerase